MENIPVEWAPVIAKAWLDDEFSAKLKYNPALAFDDFGLTYKGPVPFTVPARPKGLEMGNLQPSSTSELNCTWSKMIFAEKPDAKLHNGNFIKNVLIVDAKGSFEYNNTGTGAKDALSIQFKGPAIGKMSEEDPGKKIESITFTQGFYLYDTVARD